MQKRSLLRADFAESPWLENGEGILVLALIAEVIFFGVAAPAFHTWANVMEILRFSVELGLLSIALTPIILTGGIDLSVGSAVGLCAVVFGVTWDHGNNSIATAATAALFAGIACGALNALLVSRLKLPPLVVTLGTFSLYRGIAEGVTHGAASYTGYPSKFLQIGQGYQFGTIPKQLPILLIIALAYFVFLHRSIYGREVYAIGFNAEGARYAGIPVERRLALLYVLCGTVSGMAAILYVAHLGLAKADLGTGYELQAITAVVLGGTSILGGRGNLFGTLLGLFFLSILQNGMHLLAMPSELTGVLTGVLLLCVVGVDRLRARRGPGPAGEAEKGFSKWLLAGGTASIVALAYLAYHAVGASRTPPAEGHAATQNHRLVIAVMPKAKGDPYFISARAGAEEAAQQLGVDLVWDGPTSLDASQQNELVESWITRGVDAIVVAVENKGSISAVLRKARSHGIPVLTWDADAEINARDFFLNQATPAGIANTLTDEAARLVPGDAQFAIVTGALSAENQNEWIADIKKRVAEKYPRLHLVTIQPSDDDRNKAFRQTQTILKVYPEVKIVIAISAPAVPGAAEAVQQSGRKDVDVIGLSLPSICRSYIHSGFVQTIVLWNTRDLGYLTVYGGWLAAQKKITAMQTTIDAGRLGKLQVEGSEIILGRPLIINRENVDQLNF